MRSSRSVTARPPVPARHRLGVALAALLLVPLLLPRPATAQDGFLFDRPIVSLALFGGWFVPRAESDIFDFTGEELTVEDGDFQAPLLRGELGLRVTERMDVTLGVGYARSETRSEFREFVDQDDLPIVQTTTLSTVPVSLTLKGYLRDRGRSVSRFAWVPATWSPWIAAGGGIIRYSFQQEGDFVDYDTWAIFSDRYESEGTGTLFHVATGADVSLTPRLVLTGDARYQWASAEMGGSFDGFDAIDLGGFQVSAGLSVRF